MRDVLSSEAILPCLLDRLIDDSPGVTRETHYRQSLTLTHYRKSVLRDLGWLLNSPSHLLTEAIAQFPEVSKSVLNYGTPDMCGKSSSTLNSRDLENQITESITQFEPRIMPHTLVVRVVPPEKDATPNIIAFKITGLMWANMVPEEFFLETRLDLETGELGF